eukprot:m.193236 g.193236  ORF g.193236 m.193236 type:complete len:88 (+) comp25768_c2_seq3:130-393(+)
MPSLDTFLGEHFVFVEFPNPEQSRWYQVSQVETFGDLKRKIQKEDPSLSRNIHLTGEPFVSNATENTRLSHVFKACNCQLAKITVEQ